MKIRGFEKITKYKNAEFPMPVRKTKTSAGYDICVPEDVALRPNRLVMVPTGVKAYMQPDEFLGVHIRSSMAVKKGLRLVNNIGIIDADYYNNPDNEGHIMLALVNTGLQPLVLKKGERVAQGIFYKYLTTDDDDKTEKTKRSGGFGSTGTVK
ncbi:MAG: dUTP diphosphatase [Acidaminococcaceae bacterium]|nr:dUTP diphosphatase [Acidaminococcaceae bacterium]MBQ9697825.1 dUTP diphosphatase [Acidaminococcaceae bacterium]